MWRQETSLLRAEVRGASRLKRWSGIEISKLGLQSAQRDTPSLSMKTTLRPLGEKRTHPLYITYSLSRRPPGRGWQQFVFYAALAYSVCSHESETAFWARVQLRIRRQVSLWLKSFEEQVCGMIAQKIKNNNILASDRAQTPAVLYINGTRAGRIQSGISEHVSSCDSSRCFSP